MVSRSRLPSSLATANLNAREVFVVPFCSSYAVLVRYQRGDMGRILQVLDCCQKETRHCNDNAVVIEQTLASRDP